MSKTFLILEHIKFSGANSVAGITHGFPSVGAFLGFGENLNIYFKSLRDSSVLARTIILSHDCNSRLYRKNDSVNTYRFFQKRATLTAKGENTPIIQEGYIDGDISLIFELDNNSLLYESDIISFCQLVKTKSMSLRLAGGYIDSILDVSIIEESQLKEKLRSLYPFSCLSCDSGSISKIKKRDNVSDLEALLSVSSLSLKLQDSGWSIYRKNDGYQVVLHVGYKAISRDFNEADDVALRASGFNGCFVEPVFSIGKWLCSVKDTLKVIEENYSAVSWLYCTSNNYFLFNDSIK